MEAADGLDEQEAARIRALLGEIESQRARGELAFAGAPLRLYEVGGGRFVRVLDEHEEPVSPQSLAAIAGFLNSRRPDADELATDADTRVEDDGNAGCRHTEEVEQSSTQGSTFLGADGPDLVGGESSGGLEGMGVTNVLQEEQGSRTSVAATSNDAATPNTHPANEHEEHLGIAEVKEAATRRTATPQELHARQVRVADWLQGSSKALEPAEQPMDDNCDPIVPLETLGSGVERAVDAQDPLMGWPTHLEERRRIWFEASVAAESSTRDQPVLYWVQNCFRVTQSNFALEAATLVAQRLGAPLALVAFARSAAIYPVRHSQTASDAYLRWSLLEMQDQCAQANVAFHGISADEADGEPKLSSGRSDGHEWQRNQLVAVLDAFHPRVVVTDTTFDVTRAGDMMRVARYLSQRGSAIHWSLVAVDSASYVPVHNISLRARASLERSATLLSEEEFGQEYAAALAQHASGMSGGVSNLQLQKVEVEPASASAKTPGAAVSGALRSLGLELINWAILRSVAHESSTELPTFTERAGLKALNALLAEVDHRPAIQAEFQGGGVLSLLPFVRQGSLFSGYVVQRIAEAIDFFPAPVTAQDRKALAALKVMRSRAVSHLAKERDYALYLSLWVASQHEAVAANSLDVSPLSGSSSLIDSLGFSGLINAPLDAYARLLPPWVNNNTRLAQPASASSRAPLTDGAAYAPYELGSAHTQDAYWNAIQRLFTRHQYLHPLLVAYWAYRVMQWAVSARAGIATIDALVSQCAVGSAHSPDAVFMIWNALFLRLERSEPEGTSSTSVLADPRAFQHALELELASQPKLQLP